MLDTAHLTMTKEDGNYEKYVTIADNGVNVFDSLSP